jgi:AraC-like DNA-binding protein
MRPTRQAVPPSPYASWRYDVRSEPRFGFDWHYHPECELVLIREGSGLRYVGDRIEPYGPGDLVLVGGNMPHTWESESAGRHRAVTMMFRRDAFGPGLFDSPEFQQVKHMLDRSAWGLRFEGSGVADVADAIVAADDLDAARRSVRLLEILVSLSELGSDTLATRSMETGVDAAARQRVDLVVGLIHRDYAEELTVAWAADLVAMTPDAFSRFFRRHVGLTFTDYVNAIRIAAACHRLSEGDASIGAIASDCGYQNLSHFNRRFRLRTGMSPREYRRRFHR